jgi:hypothetical protein
MEGAAREAGALQGELQGQVASVVKMMKNTRMSLHAKLSDTEGMCVTCPMLLYEHRKSPGWIAISVVMHRAADYLPVPIPSSFPVRKQNPCQKSKVWSFLTANDH